MAEARYATTETLALESVLEVYRRAQEFDAFVGFSPSFSQNAFFEHDGALPQLGDVTGLVIVDVQTVGRLPLKGEPWSSFVDIVLKGHGVWENGRLIVECGFAEKGSKQSKHAYDVASVVLSAGRLFFDYAPNGSRAHVSPEAARQFLGEVIGGVGLPMRIVAVGTNFKLEHTANGELLTRVVFGLNDLNPSGFVCEMPGSTPEAEIDRLRRFIELFASKRFTYSWHASGLLVGAMTVPEGLGKRVYNAVVDANMPAESYELHLTFRIEGLEALAALHAMCGPKDEVFSELCGFDIAGDNHGSLKVHTTASGHRVLLSLRLATGLRMVEQRLGVQFRSDAA